MTTCTKPLHELSSKRVSTRKICRLSKRIEALILSIMRFHQVCLLDWKAGKSSHQLC